MRRASVAWLMPGALGEHRDDADDCRCHLATANLPAERRHDSVIGDVQIQSEHRLALRTELGLDHGLW